MRANVRSILGAWVLSWPLVLGAAQAQVGAAPAGGGAGTTPDRTILLAQGGAGTVPQVPGPLFPPRRGADVSP